MSENGVVSRSGDSGLNDDTERLIRLAGSGDCEASAALFSRFRNRVKRVVQLRLHKKLQGRLDGSDIVQDALLVAASKLPQYVQDPQLPFYLWLRQIACWRIAEVHRQHLGTAKRDPRREVYLGQQDLEDLDTASLAEALLAKGPSVAEQVAVSEQRNRLEKSLLQLSSLDRELIALKHFEQLTITEMSLVLNIPRATIGRKYLKALTRLRILLGDE